MSASANRSVPVAARDGWVTAGISALVAVIVGLFVPASALEALPAADGEPVARLALAVFVTIGGLGLAVALAYREFLSSTVVNRGQTAIYVLPDTLLLKVTWITVVAAPVCSAVAAQWGPIGLAVLGALFVGEIGGLLELTRRRTFLTTDERARLPLDEGLENRKLFLPGALGSLAVVVWVCAATVVREGFRLEALAYPVGIGAVVVALFTYYPFLLAWTFGGPDYMADLAFKFVGFLATGGLLVPLLLDRADRDAGTVLVSGVVAGVSFALLMELLRRRAFHQYVRERAVGSAH